MLAFLFKLLVFVAVAGFLGGLWSSVYDLTEANKAPILRMRVENAVGLDVEFDPSGTASRKVSR